MPAVLMQDDLVPVLQTSRDTVAAVVDSVYFGRTPAITLKVCETLAGGDVQDTAEHLITILRADAMTATFVALLRNRETTFLPFTVPEPVDAANLGDPNTDPKKMAEFSRTALVRRCRIGLKYGAGTFIAKGSGTLVGRRLVLTAAHVLAEALEAPDNDDAARIFVTDIAGNEYAARLVFHLPPHELELARKSAPDEAYETHPDVALLRLFKPIGQKADFGHFDLTEVEEPRIGTWRLFLLHFPGGTDIGYSIRCYARHALRSMYLPHDVSTKRGSSGGAGFSGSFRFVGHHQAGFDGSNSGRLVPYERYASNPGFRAALEADRPPAYLWSLDETPDGHFIIGRSLFFNALAAMLDETASPLLRGIWVRRMDPALPAKGLSFSHDMLTAFLLANGRADEIHRISVDLGVDGLLATVQQDILGVSDDLVAPPGPHGNEIGHAEWAADRAAIVARRLEKYAAATDRIHWLFFDNPPNAVLDDPRIEFEQLVVNLLDCDHWRVILSGFETYTLRDRLFDTIKEARDRGRAGLLVEHIGEFTEVDVHRTISAMSDSLGLEWTREQVDDIVRRALAVLESVAGVYSTAGLETLVRALRKLVMRRLEGAS